MNEHAKKERPALITLICILGFLGVASGLWGLESPYDRELGTTFQAYHAVVLTLSLIVLIGLWKMKKWSVILYGVIAVINPIVLWQVWHFTFLTMMVALVLNAFIIILGVYNFPKMN